MHGACYWWDPGYSLLGRPSRRRSSDIRKACNLAWKHYCCYESDMMEKSV